MTMNAAGTTGLLRDAELIGTSIQAFVPDPAKIQVPITLAGTKVFKRGSGGDYDITGWLAICIAPSAANLTRYFNTDTTKTRIKEQPCNLPSRSTRVKPSKT